MLRYVTHADVLVDPLVPVPRWGLSERGRTRVVRMLDQPWVPTVGRIVSSDETKALQAAAILAGHLGLVVEVRAATGEIDRSSTGYVPHDRHDALADRCFAEPTVSAEGWERAVDAQVRIVEALADLFVGGAPPTVVVGHGGMGTLLWCHLAGVAIDRRHDQPGQGHYYAVDPATRGLAHGWRAIDDIEPG